MSEENSGPLFFGLCGHETPSVGPAFQFLTNLPSLVGGVMGGSNPLGETDVLHPLTNRRLSPIIQLFAGPRYGEQNHDQVWRRRSRPNRRHCRPLHRRLGLTSSGGSSSPSDWSRCPQGRPEPTGSSSPGEPQVKPFEGPHMIGNAKRTPARVLLFTHHTLETSDYDY